MSKATLTIETGLESRPLLVTHVKTKEEALERARKLYPIGLQKSVKVEFGGEVIYARNLLEAPYSFLEANDSGY